MAYDEQLAARIRTLLADRTDVSERKMFGGLTFMISGNMCCGVNRDELVVRLDPTAEDDALARPHARPMDLTGRRMRGFVTVHPDGLKGNRLNRWVQEVVARAESLPAKQEHSHGAVLLVEEARSDPFRPLSSRRSSVTQSFLAVRPATRISR